MPEEKPNDAILKESSDQAIAEYRDRFYEEIRKENVERARGLWNKIATNVLAKVCNCPIVPRGKLPMIVHQGMTKSSKDVAENKKTQNLR